MGLLALAVQAASTTEFGALLLGPHVDLGVASLSANARYTWTYERRRPLRARSYDAFDDDPASGPANHYASVDGWLWGYVPVGSLPLVGYWELGGVYLLEDPAPYAVFEEYFRATMNGRSAAMTRAVVWWTLLRQSLAIGPAVDAVFSPERSPIVRLGGGATWHITEHLTLDALLSVPVISPDGLDWFTQSWGIGRMSYVWASGEPKPGL